MRPQKMEINPGDRFGMLTVMCEKEKSKAGHRQYEVRCDCGKQYIVLRGFLFKDNPKCLECRRKYAQKSDKGNAIGQTINNWYVIAEVEKKENGTRKFQCRCNQCGSLSIKSKAQMQSVKTNRCENCPPDYQFRYKGNTAIGTLPDGTEFLIDREDVPRVTQKYWRVHKEYISTKATDGSYEKLHNFLLNYTPGENMVDHINRNRMDCRKSNLRIVTPHQNSMNRSIGRNNTTGYVGVCFLKKKKIYKAKISLGNRSIHLGQSKNPIECAQMYNCAAMLLFKEFHGHLNDVPEAGTELRQTIENKLLPYLAESAAATQSCGLFLRSKGA
ncbi:HNH endonuclease [Eubacterium limosum]|uniref:HNH endonuclease n=1 Tax=Eubacterium limosum TaxID=1736 RepID=A0ABT5UT44_EUBLI|nr:HNH endonuclease [Eubacterium limosum]MDE1472140.1 HNH endonuclease [Eubacterium limosum]